MLDLPARKTKSRPSSSASAGRLGDDSEPPGPSGGRQTPCHIQYQLLTADCQPRSKGWLEKQLARIAAQAGVQGGEISIVLVDDDRMAEMHEQYSGIGGTTDILTFDHREDDGEPMEADLVICLDVAAREAAARGHEVRLELLLYAVHGLNHLLGGDDHTAKGARDMHAWEDRMLTQAGFGAVFHREAKADGKPKADRKKAYATPAQAGGNAVKKKVAAGSEAKAASTKAGKKKVVKPAVKKRKKARGSGQSDAGKSA